ncbi:unnamed protein product [Anisakis simplex]|uniref:Uncharacterized protein n=1 Tax=Anisakis simplex TaxID=6269 RepID=A0A0M3J147_ANISI|nr:unnamed protein product [Anisakis simplex]VDK67678.1 unnamed protein product [Anisakis simplex]
MLRKPTWKRWRRRERELRERSTAPLAVDDDYTGTADSDEERFSIKKRVLKSRIGKSLSRLGERRNSDDIRKKRSVEKECHSAIDFYSTEDTE